MNIYYEFFSSFQHRTCTWTEGLFFSGVPDTTSCRCSDFFWDIFLHFPWTFTQTWAFFFFWVFCTLYHADAPVFFGTLTQTLGLLFSGFCTCCRCSGNSAFLWDIYLNTGVVFFGFFEHYIMQMLWTVLGHLLRLQGCFFWAFRTSPGHVPHFFMAVTHYLGYYPWNYLSTSCRCSRFSWNI